MSDPFRIDTLALGAGTLGLSALPGRHGDLDRDLGHVKSFGPALVLTLALTEELEAHGAAALPRKLVEAGIDWAHFPIGDFGAPRPEDEGIWRAIARRIRATLADGGRVLIHCKAGRGRTGTAALRLMVEAGEAPETALARLRATRAGAVETEAQQRWAEAARTRPATP